ncbi:MAG: hypothetical protein J2P22_08105 [Nocardioides sp.]|nr:hypothetical protein [Nocardioides sp.]
MLTDPTVLAWRALDSGCRFVHVAADHHRAPIRGHVTAVLSCDQHREFWDALQLATLEAGRTRALRVSDLAEAWQNMPIIPPDTQTPPEPPSRTPATSPTPPASARAAVHGDDPDEARTTTRDDNSTTTETTGETKDETKDETTDETTTETTTETPARAPAAS